MSLMDNIGVAPGRVRLRGDAPTPAAYAVFDCETTGTTPGLDEIVSFAAVRLDPDGLETARLARLVRPSRSIPAEATAVHGISDEDVASALCFGELSSGLLALLDGAVFVAHNAGFDLAMLQHAFARSGIEFRPLAVACTLEAFRLLDPLAPNHRLESVCERQGIVVADRHDASGDVLATASLLRLLLDAGIAPETVQLDRDAFLRLRTRGDARPATEPQIRRVFGMARSAGLLLPGGGIDRSQVLALVRRVAGAAEIDALTREQVQDVFDALEQLIAARPVARVA